MASNTARGIGGMFNSGQMTVRRSTVDGNSSDVIVSNCTLLGNSAFEGGGASFSTLNNCIIRDNWATDLGGGTSDGTLNNCTVTANQARVGGGVSGGTVNNCIIYFNLAETRADWDGTYGIRLNYSSPSFQPVASNILGQAGITTYTNRNAAGAGPLFYRVGVGN